MPSIKELENLDTVVDDHSHFPVEPSFSKGWARSIIQRCEKLNIKPPIVIRRFQDRVTDPKGHDGALQKIGRDFYGRDYNELTQKQRNDVDDLHSKLWNPAGTSEYLKKGLS